MFKFKGYKNLKRDTFGNLLKKFVALISKWPGISKFYPPILEYRMLCVLSNDLLVYGSSHGTPCISMVFLVNFKDNYDTATTNQWVLTSAQLNLVYDLLVQYIANVPQSQ